MLNQNSIEAVNRSKFSANFLAPLYSSYCFSNLPGFVKQVLTNQTFTNCLPGDVLGGLPTHYDKVVFFFVDAFGWRFFEEFKDDFSLLKRLKTEGVVSKLTSQFPSTTACHVTCMHTGLPVGQSGVFEWYYYEPKVDAIVSPLLFSFAADKKKRDTLLSVGVSPADLFPSQTIYQDLSRCGIKSFVFQDQDYANSAYSQHVLRGSEIVPYKGVTKALSLLVERLKSDTGKGYYFVYIDDFDAICHNQGPGAKQTRDAARAVFKELEESFYQKVSGWLKDTLLVLTADHGQVEIDPATTIYLDKILPDFGRLLKTTAKGELMVPGGSARDMFLYVKEECLSESVGLLKAKLQDLAEVHLTSELISAGLFGPGPSKELLSRLGNVVILPFKHQSVWWYDAGRFANTFYGHHGGITREEAEIFLGNLALV